MKDIPIPRDVDRRGWGGLDLGMGDFLELTADAKLRPLIQPTPISKLRAAGFWQCGNEQCEDFAQLLEGEFDFLYDHDDHRVHFNTRRTCHFCDQPQLFMPLYVELLTLSDRGYSEFSNGRLLTVFRTTAYLRCPNRIVATV